MSVDISAGNKIEVTEFEVFGVDSRSTFNWQIDPARTPQSIVGSLALMKYQADFTGVKFPQIYLERLKEVGKVPRAQISFRFNSNDE